MKRFFALISALVLTMSFASCGNTDSSQDVDIPVTTTTTTTTATATEPVTTTSEPSSDGDETTVTTTVVTTTTPNETTTTTAKTTKKSGIVTESASGTMYANKTANIRKGNSTDYDVVAQVKINTKVTITGKCENGWYAVKCGDYTGYMASSVLSSAKTETTTTTTAKKTTTTTTTTTAKKTTTTTTTKKSSDDSQYKMTALMKHYNAIRMNCPTAADIKAVEDDLAQYAYKLYNGKSGTLDSYGEGRIQEAFDYMGISMTRSYSTFTASRKLNLTIDDTMDFSDAHLNIYCDNQAAYSENETAEQAYYKNLWFMTGCYGVAEDGIHSAVVNGFETDFSYYFCVENDNHSTGGKKNWYTIWFVCG